jgi:zinc transporter, ZIP family
MNQRIERALRLGPPPAVAWLVAFAVVASVAAAATGLHLLVMSDAKVLHAWWAGLAAAGATAVGTLPAMLSLQGSPRARHAMLGFGSGVMLAATAFSLVVPGIHAAQAQGHGPWVAAGIVGSAMLLGAAMLVTLDHGLPLERFVEDLASRERALLIKRTWLFVFAVALHNLPEGLAIGVAFGGTSTSTASALATGIAIQDIPEGLVIAMALRSAGYGRSLSVGLGAVSGLVEPITAVLGAGIVTFSAPMLPWGLAFAAGAMLYVVSHEMIPESHRLGPQRDATVWLMLGFVLMMAMDTALG